MDDFIVSLPKLRRAVEDISWYVEMEGLTHIPFESFVILEKVGKQLLKMAEEEYINSLNRTSQEVCYSSESCEKFEGIDDTIRCKDTQAENREDRKFEFL